MKVWNVEGEWEARPGVPPSRVLGSVSVTTEENNEAGFTERNLTACVRGEIHPHMTDPSIIYQ